MNLGPGRGKDYLDPEAKAKESWVRVVDSIRVCGASTLADFEAMLAEINKNAERDGVAPHQTPEWRRKNLMEAFREAGIELWE